MNRTIILLMFTCSLNLLSTKGHEYNKTPLQNKKPNDDKSSRARRMPASDFFERIQKQRNIVVDSNKQNRNSMLHTNSKLAMFASSSANQVPILKLVVFKPISMYQDIVTNGATEMYKKIVNISSTSLSDIQTFIDDNVTSLNSYLQTTIKKIDTAIFSILVTEFNACLAGVQLSIKDITSIENTNAATSLHNTNAELNTLLTEKNEDLATVMRQIVVNELTSVLNNVQSYVTYGYDQILNVIYAMLNDSKIVSSIFQELKYIDPAFITTLLENHLNSINSKFDSLEESRLVDISGFISGAKASEEELISTVLKLENDKIITAINTQINSMITALKTSISIEVSKTAAEVNSHFESAFDSLNTKIQKKYNKTNNAVKAVIENSRKDQINQISAILTGEGNQIEAQIRALFNK